MIAAAGSGDNIVGIEIRPYVTKEGLGTFREISKEAKATEKSVVQSAREAAKEQVKQARDAEREAERLHTRHRGRQLERARESRRVAEQEAKDSARAAAIADKENDRVHQRMRQRQLDRAKESRKTADQESKDAARAAAVQEKESDRVHQRIRQRQLDRAKESRRAAEVEAKVAERAAAAQDKENDRVHQRMRQRQLERARDHRRAMDEQVRNEERAAARTAAAQARMVAGWKQAAKGVTDLGRALVLLGGENRTIEAIAQKLVIFEGIVSGVKGVGGLAGGVAKGVGGAMRGFGGAAGSAAAGAAGAGATTAGLGATATAGLALADVAIIAADVKLFHEAITGNAKKLNSWTNKIAEAEVGFAQWVRKTTGISTMGAYGVSGAMLDRLNAQEASLARMTKDREFRAIQNERFGRQQAIVAEGDESLFNSSLTAGAATAGRGLVGAARDEAINAARRRAFAGRMTESRATVARIEGGGGMSGENADASLAIALQRIKQSAEELAKLDEERLDIAKRKGQEALEVERSALTAARERHQQVKAELSELKGRFQSEAEQFASLDPVKARQTVLAARKARGGGQLGFKEAELLKGFSEFDNQVADAGVRRARQLGGGFILDPLESRMKSLTKQEAELKVKVTEQKVKVELVESNLKTQAEQISEEITKTILESLKERDEAIRKFVEFKTSVDAKQFEAELRQRQAQEASAN